jgi:para-aminobenzoate synthetase/4-amino-4-deoxychorismate lyase
MRSHPVPYGTFVNTGKRQFITLSPELFLSKTGMKLTTIPMKGTAARRPIPSDDAEVVSQLSCDEKNRAENLMIVDMARNDLGRICEPGTIKVDNIFSVETYASLHQMVSEVRGELQHNLTISEIFKAMFPAASITGAPKIRAMQIIRELEKSPRGVYTGSVGCIIPNGDFLFNVAIRTISITSDKLEIGIGSGVVADSNPSDEWRECLLKSEFATHHHKNFELLETMLWNRNDNSATGHSIGKISFFEEHLNRLKRSADYFGIKFDICDLRANVAEACRKIPKSANTAKLRLTMSIDGIPNTTYSLLKNAGWGKSLLKVAISADSTNSKNVFHHHKTTNRIFYNTRFQKALELGFDEVLFVNECKEVTEGAISNIFAKKNGKWRTPPLKCGVLPGIFRAQLINELPAKESILFVDDLLEADEISLCNSVRGVAPALLDVHSTVRVLE